MATVQLRDIATDADRAAAREMRTTEYQERFVSPVDASFRDAVLDARAAPRMWTLHDDATMVGFVMISDGIPQAVLDAEAEIVGPYYLWRLLIDVRYQRQGYGTAALDAVVAYLRDRPGADVLWTSAGQGEGSPQPFYERYGFIATDRIIDDEVVLRLDLPRKDR
jgi:diamine N-acetyltransferase